MTITTSANNPRLSEDKPVLDEIIKNLERRWGLTLASFLPPEAQACMQVWQMAIARLWGEGDAVIRRSREWIEYADSMQLHCTQCTLTRSDPGGPVSAAVFIKPGRQLQDVLHAIDDITSQIAPFKVVLTRLALNGAIFTAWGETIDEPARKQREQLLRGFAKHLPDYCNVRMREWDTDSAKYGDIHCSIAALKRQPPQEYQSLVNNVAGIAGLQCDPFTIAGVTLVHHRMRTLAFPQQGSWYFPFGLHATMPAESDVLGLDTTLSTGDAKP